MPGDMEEPPPRTADFSSIHRDKDSKVIYLAASATEDSVY